MNRYYLKTPHFNNSVYAEFKRQKEIIGDHEEAQKRAKNIIAKQEQEFIQKWIADKNKEQQLKEDVITKVYNALEKGIRFKNDGSLYQSDKIENITINRKGNYIHASYRTRRYEFNPYISGEDDVLEPFEVLQKREHLNERYSYDGLVAAYNEWIEIEREKEKLKERISKLSNTAHADLLDIENDKKYRL